MSLFNNWRNEDYFIRAVLKIVGIYEKKVKYEIEKDKEKDKEENDKEV